MRFKHHRVVIVHSVRVHNEQHETCGAKSKSAYFAITSDQEQNIQIKQDQDEGTETEYEWNQDEGTETEYEWNQDEGTDTEYEWNQETELEQEQIEEICLKQENLT